MDNSNGNNYGNNSNNQNAYNQNADNQNGYNQNGYNQNTYNQSANNQEGFMDKAEGFFDKASDFITENGEKFGGMVKDFAQEHDLDTKAGNAAGTVGTGVRHAIDMIKRSFGK